MGPGTGPGSVGRGWQLPSSIPHSPDLFRGLRQVAPGGLKIRRGRPCEPNRGSRHKAGKCREGLASPFIHTSLPGPVPGPKPDSARRSEDPLRTPVRTQPWVPAQGREVWGGVGNSPSSIPHSPGLFRGLRQIAPEGLKIRCGRPCEPNRGSRHKAGNCRAERGGGRTFYDPQLQPTPRPRAGARPRECVRSQSSPGRPSQRMGLSRHKAGKCGEGLAIPLHPYLTPRTCSGAYARARPEA